VGGTAGTTWGLIRAEQRRVEAEQAQAAEAKRVVERDDALALEAQRVKERDAALEESNYQLDSGNFLLAVAAYDNRDVALTRLRLDSIQAKHRSWEWHYLRRQSTGGIFTLYGHTSGVYSVAFSPKAGRVLIGLRSESSSLYTDMRTKNTFRWLAPLVVALVLLSLARYLWITLRTENPRTTPDKKQTDIAYPDLDPSLQRDLTAKLSKALALAVEKRLLEFYHTCGITDPREMQLFERFDELAPRAQDGVSVYTIYVIMPRSERSSSGSWELQGDDSTCRLRYTRIKGSLKHPVAIMALLEVEWVDSTPEFLENPGNRW
jgi:hypothetical protein